MTSRHDSDSDSDIESGRSGDTARHPTRRDLLKGRFLPRQDRSHASPAPDDVSSTPPAQNIGLAGDSYLFQISRHAMACEFQLYLNAGQAQAGTEHGLAALELLEPLEQQLSVYRADSEVSLLNRNAAQQECRVEPRLFRLLQQAVEISERTAGAFDITTGPLTRTWGFSRREGQMPSQEAIDEALQSVGYQHLRLNAEHQTFRFTRPDMEVNLGAIGKGYALDRIGSELITSGSRDFLVQGGRSSVLARGDRLGAHVADRGWLVALQHPLRSDLRLAEIWLKDQALGTSGCGNQFFHHQGKRYGHILDPRSGWPAAGTWSATVIADTAREADALATALYVMGPQEAAVLCQDNPEVKAILVIPGERSGDHQLLGYNMESIEWTLCDPSDSLHRPL